MKRYQVIIAGKGLSALCLGAKLVELGVNDILMVADGCGGTPAIAAINFVLPDDEITDSVELYEKDMINAGYGINHPDLVKVMAEKSQETWEFLKQQGIQFAQEKDGRIKRRRLSGHSVPRSLCQTTGLVGIQLQQKLTEILIKNGVTFIDGECVRVLSDGKEAYGITVLQRNQFNKLQNIYGNHIVAAWGGVGSLFSRTTYPRDINGNTLAVAYKAGATLCDLEFVEYEPMVVAYPSGVVGEPCPTAMLGEGAYLLNGKGDRFVLPYRSEGEAGAPKSLLNRLIWQEISNGRGTPHGGVYVDMRHIDSEILKGYPWFYNRIMENGIDPNRDMIEVAPMAHSFSGGIEVDQGCHSSIKRFYAVGEAAGGFHGACRCAGNAASQAAISGIICAETIAAALNNTTIDEKKRFPCERRIEPSIRLHYIQKIQEAFEMGMTVYRKEEDLQHACNVIERISREKAAVLDDDTQDMCLACLLILKAAINRKESRGTHNRLDYPSEKTELSISRTYGQNKI